ncbi:MAG TPA: redoxin domain-containing protein [Gemmatimonadales bacterium]|jgi:peroxiredoxin (alkyl hydroperoxide reductase subunit C)|nr:redoxin domain-containing protein [Gemmatimonadales bacterium]
MPLPAVGAPAPDFTLPSTSGSPVSLSALKGKNVLLAFFPLAFTGTCTAELCAFSTDYSKFQNENTVVLPISVDSVPALKEFKAKEHMTVDLLSDFKREVSRRYGVLNEAKFFSNRAYVLLDQDGAVRWTHLEADNSQRRENDQLLAQLAALR